MKKLRNIFAALSTLRRTPSTNISGAWLRLRSALEGAGTGVTDYEIGLIDSIIDAVVAMAKDDEDKAAAPGKADKPAP